MDNKIISVTMSHVFKSILTGMTIESRAKHTRPKRVSDKTFMKRMGKLIKGLRAYDIDEERMK